MATRPSVAIAALVSLASLAACAKPADKPAETTVAVTGAESPTPYLFVWGADADKKVNDWLTVIDADPRSATYGKVVASVDAGSGRNMPHHLEQEFPADGQLIANGWASGKSFVFDTRDPKAPKLAAQFKEVGGFAYPHSFVRLANGHVLSTFQGHGTAWQAPGGLVEMDHHGTLVRATSAKQNGLADTLAFPYSLVVDAANDRIITTVSSMSPPDWFEHPPKSFDAEQGPNSTVLQLWSLSQLKPTKIVPLPTPAGQHLNRWPAEPRLLADGSALINTFYCGMYHVTALGSDAPVATLVHSFDGPTKENPFALCAVPSVIGRYWVQPVVAINGLVALDISNPDKPVEVDRLILPKEFGMPHWTAPDPKASRLVVTGDDMGYVLVVNVDRATGKLAIDSAFKDERTGKAGVSLDGRTWPHGAVKMSHLHGTLFGPR